MARPARRQQRRFPSGDGTAGGDFRFRVNVLPGDAFRDGVVNAIDAAAVRTRLRQRAVGGAPRYSLFCDLDGDGRIGVWDEMLVRQRLGHALPGDRAGGTVDITRAIPNHRATPPGG